VEKNFLINLLDVLRNSLRLDKVIVDDCRLVETASLVSKIFGLVNGRLDSLHSHFTEFGSLKTHDETKIEQRDPDGNKF
jgi:hypothetical protein